MPKLLVTHFYPDIDGICGIWLFKRFGGKHFEKCDIQFVPAGSTWEGQASDSDADIIHIDTGLGLYDHHHSNEYTCAARKVYDGLKLEDEALLRIVEQVTVIDHFGDSVWHEPLNDIYDFHLSSIISGWETAYPNRHRNYVEWGLIALDGVYNSLKSKIDAEATIEENALTFETIWGDGMAVQTFNDEVLKVGLKKGFAIVVRRDPLKHYIRVKAHPYKDIDLTVIYEKLIALDPEATWFLHPDKKQLLNGNTKNPNNVFTKLSLEDAVEVLKIDS